MIDLVDYLRVKLEHADDVVCICTYADFPAGRFLWDYVKGCPIHEEHRLAELEQQRSAVVTGRPSERPEVHTGPPSRKRWWR